MREDKVVLAQNEAWGFILGSLNLRKSSQEKRDKIDCFFAEECLAKYIFSPRSSFDYYNRDTVYVKEFFI